MSTAATPGTVLVTGGTGYIAGYLIQRLLADGWTVHTTVRSRSREPELRRLLPAPEGRLRLFEADLTADAGWAAAAEGCSHVAHVASPVAPGSAGHADELIVPARDGTLRALKAAQQAGAQRFVMTSSVAAVSYGRPRGVHHLTEADWTDLSAPGLSPYVQSKTLAERAARDWVARHGGAMEFVAICPAVVLGPVWSADYSPSVDVVARLLAGKPGACPDFGFGVVDVRDLAELHRLCLVTPGLAGERFIASSRFLKLIEVARILHQALGPQAARVPTRTLPDWVVRLVALFDPMARAIVQELGNVREQDSSHAKARLGWATRPAEHSIADAAQSLLALSRP